MYRHAYRHAYRLAYLDMCISVFVVDTWMRMAPLDSLAAVMAELALVLRVFLMDREDVEAWDILGVEQRVVRKVLGVHLRLLVESLPAAYTSLGRIATPRPTAERPV